MKNLFVAAALVCSSTAFCAWVPIAEAQQLVDRVMVSIEGEPITYSEIQRFASEQGKNVEGLSANDPQVRAVVEEVVVKRLLDKEAEALNISVTNDEVNAYLAEIRRQNGVDEETFKTILQERGIGWQSYLSQVKTDIIKNRVVSARVRSKVNVVDEDISRYLDGQPALRPALGTRRVFQISLGSNEAQAKAQRAAIAKQLKEKENFNAVALLEAGAQDLGYINEEDLRKEIARVLEDTRDGELSTVVEIGGQQTAYYVVGTITEEEPVDPVLEKEISAKVFEQKFSERLKEFIDTELPKRYHVEKL